MRWLEFKQGPVPIEPPTVPLADLACLIVGRESGADLRLGDPRVSGRHLRLEVSPHEVRCTDLGSRNGSFIDGVRLTAACELRAGQCLRVGDTDLVLREDAVPADTVPELLGEAGGTILGERAMQLSASEAGLAGLDAGERANRLARRLKLLERAVQALQSAVERDELLRGAMELLFEALHADSGLILAAPAAAGGAPEPLLAYACGRPCELAVAPGYSRTLVRQAMTQGRGLLFDPASSPGQELSLSIVDMKIRTAICCPIHAAGEVLGALYLDSRGDGGLFGEEDLDLAMGVAGIAGAAWANLNLRARLETQGRIRDNLKRYVSANIAERIIDEGGRGNFHLQSQKLPVTVLFADIRRFTPLAEALAPAAVAQLLNHYFAAMSEIIFRHGGTLDKFVGDRIMVLFNAPFPMAEPELVAARTALEMQQELIRRTPAWVAEGLPSFQVGIGIHSGEGVAGCLGTAARMEYTAIGDCVNVASRVCDVAQPGAVVVTAAVARALGERLPLAPLGEVSLKGKSVPVPVFEVLPPPA